MTAILAMLMLSWTYTLPPAGEYVGDVVWVKNQFRPWESWNAGETEVIGSVEFSVSGDRFVYGVIRADERKVWWWDRHVSVRYENEWWEGAECPNGCWLFILQGDPAQNPFYSYSQGEGNWVAALSLIGVSYLGNRPTTSLQFRWRAEKGGVRAQAYGFWTAWPSFQYMSYGFDTWKL